MTRLLDPGLGFRLLSDTAGVEGILVRSRVPSLSRDPLARVGPHGYSGTPYDSPLSVLWTPVRSPLRLTVALIAPDKTSNVTSLELQVGSVLRSTLMIVVLDTPLRFVHDPDPWSSSSDPCVVQLIWTNGHTPTTGVFNPLINADYL